MPPAARLRALTAQLLPCRERYTASPSSAASKKTTSYIADDNFASPDPVELPPPPHTEVPKFAIGSDGARDYLEEHGFCVCSGALTTAECDGVLDGMWEFLESLGTGIQRAEPRTWTDAAWPDQGGLGLICNAGVTHTDWAWRVRGHEQVVNAWSSVLDLPPSELIASLDCLSMFRPWGLAEAEPSWRTRGAWWHVDQTVDTRTNEAGQEVGGTQREYIQGFVTIVDTSEESGGFAVVDGSHVNFAELDADEVARAAACATGIIPALTKGDLLLWDARALHCSYPGVPTGTAAGSEAATGQAAQAELLRATVHMCLSPKALATSEVLEQVRSLYRCSHHVLTTHDRA